MALSIRAFPPRGSFLSTRPSPAWPRHAHRVSRAPNLNLDQPPIRHPLHDRVDARDAGNVAEIVDPDPLAARDGREDLGLVFGEISHGCRPAPRDHPAECDLLRI